MLELEPSESHYWLEEIDPDDGVKLYMTDPGGHFGVILRLQLVVEHPILVKYLQKEYDFNISFENLKLLTIRTSQTGNRKANLMKLNSNWA